MKTQGLRRSYPITAVLSENRRDQLSSEVIYCVAVRKALGLGTRVIARYCRRQVGNTNDSVLPKDDCVFDHIGQFSHIPWPAVAGKLFQSFVGDRRKMFLSIEGKPFYEKLR